MQQSPPAQSAIASGPTVAPAPPSPYSRPSSYSVSAKWVRSIALNAAVVLVFLIWEHAFSALELSPGLTVWASASGLSIALLIRFGLAPLPAIIMGHALTSFWMRGNFFSPSLTYGLALLLGALYALTASALKRLGGPSAFKDTRGMRRFVLVSASLSACVGAAISFSLSFALHASVQLELWRHTAFSELLGMLLITPWLLPLLERFPRLTHKKFRFSRSLISDALIFVAATAVSFGSGFFSQFTNEFPLFYFCFLPLLWITVRRGLPGALWGTGLISISTALIMRDAQFNRQILDDIQVFLATLSVTGLSLGALVTERMDLEQLAHRHEALLGALRRLQSGFIRSGLTPEVVQSFLSRLCQQTGARLAVFITFSPEENGETPKLRRVEVSSLPEDDPIAQRWSTAWAGLPDDWPASNFPIAARLLAVDAASLMDASELLLPGWSANSSGEHPVLLLPLRQENELLGGIALIGKHDVIDAGLAQSLRSALVGLSGVVEADRTRQARLKAESRLRDKEQEQLRSQSMEALGRLAGGIAQDFNNLLTTISGHTQLLLKTEEIKRLPHATDRLEHIRDAETRAAILTQHLLAFTRKQLFAPTLFDLNSRLRELEWTLSSVLGEGNELSLELSDEPLMVFADPNHLASIILNLAFNARDAMGDQGGCFTLKTRLRRLLKSAVKPNPDLSIQGEAELMLSDNGSGMKPEVLSHAFEPFYTTHGGGARRGLGLSVVHGLVKENGGRIAITSQEGSGTQVFIGFPLKPSQEVPVISRPQSVQAEQSQTATENEKPVILVVEDDDSIRNLLLDYLRIQGYTVLSACDGYEALLASRHYPHPIDVLLTDMVMPNMGGLELSDELLLIQPQLKVLYMSGYSEDEAFKSRLREGSAHFLAKPFTPASLHKRLQELLTPQTIH